MYQSVYMYNCLNSNGNKDHPPLSAHVLQVATNKKKNELY